jgi:hypothetical protein
MVQHTTAADRPGDQVKSAVRRARNKGAQKREAQESASAKSSTHRGSRQQVLFITGLFRSGTTILWHLLRQFDNVQGYFEPLHDNLIDSLSTAAAPDPVHVGVEDYYTAYRPFLEDIQRYHRPEFGVNRLCLGGADSHPQLRDYLELLIARAEGRFPVFKMMRDDFRVPWLKQQFPKATVLYIRRNPRDVWASVVRHTPVDQRADRWLNTGFDLLIWSANLCPFFSRICSAKIGHSYERVYYLWRISTAVADRYADLIIDFDQGLQTDPAATIKRIATCIGAEVGDIERLAKMVTPRPGGEWRDYAKEALLREIERDCDAMLAESGLLDRIADGELDNTWPIAGEPTRRDVSDLADALCHEVSHHRSALIMHAENTARALARNLDRLQAESASELAARDKALAESQAYAASLKEEVKKLWADAASELAARDEAIVESQDYAGLLRRDLTNCQVSAKALKKELDKVRADSIVGIEARDKALAESQTYAASLEAELDKVQTDSAREIVSRDAEIVDSQTYARSLKEELDKVQAELAEMHEKPRALRERLLVRLDACLSHLLRR